MSLTASNACPLDGGADHLRRQHNWAGVASTDVTEPLPQNGTSAPGLHAVAPSTPQAHVTVALAVGPDLIVTKAGPSACPAGSQPPAGLVGRPLRELVHPGDVATVSALPALIAAGAAISPAVHVRVLDGAGGWCHVDLAGRGRPGS